MKRYEADFLIVTGYVGAIAMFTIATGLIAQYSKAPSKAYAGSSVAFLFLFVALYALPFMSLLLN
jgi:hypothetical protein